MSKLFKADMTFFCCYEFFFTRVDPHWIKNISTSRCAVYTSSTRYMCIDLFCICWVTFTFDLYFFHPLSLYCSSIGFNILSKFTCSINGNFNCYSLLWNFSNFCSSEGILTLRWPLRCSTHSACLFLALCKNHSNSSSEMSLYGSH